MACVGRSGDERWTSRSCARAGGRGAQLARPTGRRSGRGGFDGRAARSTRTEEDIGCVRPTDALCRRRRLCKIDDDVAGRNLPTDQHRRRQSASFLRRPTERENTAAFFSVHHPTPRLILLLQLLLSCEYEVLNTELG